MIGNRTSGAWRASGADAVLTAIVVAIAIAGFPGAGLPGAFGQCQYEPFVLEGPECPWPFSGNANLIGRGLNEHGHIAGWWRPCGSDINEAFYWTPETGIVTLPRPAGVWSAEATDINDAGIVIGTHWTIGSGALGFAFDPDTQEFQYLPPLHEGAIATFTSSANAINNSGIVAGMRIIGKPGQSPMPSNAVIWDTNTGEVIDLGVQQGPNSAARDVDTTGQIAVGWDGVSITNNLALKWENGALVTLGPIPGANTSDAGGVNDKGRIAGAGWSSVSGANTVLGFVWDSGEFAVIVPPLPFDSAGARTLNAHDQVVVLCSITGGIQRPYLWQHGEMVDLNDLTPELDGMTSPSDINNRGHILTRLGNTKAALLTPIDVPFADINYDCNVNEHDLLILLAAFGPQSCAAGPGGDSPLQADLNGDGVVNVTDLLIMLGNWNP